MSLGAFSISLAVKDIAAPLVTVVNENTGVPAPDQVSIENVSSEIPSL